MESPSPPPLPAPDPGPPPVLRPRSPLYFVVPLLRAVLYLLSFFLLQGVVSAVVLGLAHLAPGLAESPFVRSDLAFLIIFALCFPPAVGLTWLFLRIFEKRPLASVGARWPAGGPPAALRQLATVPLATAVLVAAWFALILALPAALAQVQVHGLAGDMAHPPSWWPLPTGFLFPILFLMFLIQGGLEEWILRGYVFHTLRERWHPVAAALVSSVLFALVHLGNPDVSVPALVNIVLAGLVLSALVERDGSLWGATVAHGAWNFLISCVASLPVSGIPVIHLFDVRVAGNPLATGGGFGPEGSLALTALGIPLSILLWRRALRGRPLSAAEDTPPSALEDTPPAVPL